MAGAASDTDMRPGPKNLITDIAGLAVGNAADAKLKSGVTVLTADAPFVTSVHVMGGAPGTRETDLLAADKTITEIDALVLSGGSAYGLDACSGVVEGLRRRGRGFRLKSAIVPIMPNTILMDLLNGGDKDWSASPYPALGRAAYEAAGSDFEIGTAGAGTGALTGMVKGGLGSASAILDNGVRIGALVAVNPMGMATTPGDRHFWAAPFEIGAEFGGLGPGRETGLGALSQTRRQSALADMQGGNTTIAIVATDADLSKANCQRLAVAAHDGIGRAIVPAHTPSDGDLVFALSSGQRDVSQEPMAMVELCHGAAVCLSRAIARAVFLARPEPGDLLPCWSSLNP